MKEYENLMITVIFLQQEDVITQSEVGVEFDEENWTDETNLFA